MSASVKLGALRVIIAVKDPRVISLTAGMWVHKTMTGRYLCGAAVPA